MARVDAVARVWIAGGKQGGAGRAHAKAIDAPTMPRDDEACGLRGGRAGAWVALNASKLDNCGVWMRSRVRLVVRGLRGRVGRIKRANTQRGRVGGTRDIELLRH